MIQVIFQQTEEGDPIFPAEGADGHATQLSVKTDEVEWPLLLRKDCKKNLQ